MKAVFRIVASVALLCAISDGITLAGQAGQEEMFTISGSVGLDGVEIQGLPGNIFSDAQGFYIAEVPSGFSGTVKPVKEGYIFSPPNRAYSSITSEYLEQNYTATVVTYMISGKVEGISGVQMRGLPGNRITGPDGSYKAIVEWGFSGTVTPVKEGFTFEPAAITYRDVTSNHLSGNYEADIVTLTISGTTGVSGVLMRGLPGNVVSDDKGYYRASVAYGWSGQVTPEKVGYMFDPPVFNYTRMTDDQRYQNYSARSLTLTISDTIEQDGTPIPGVNVSATNGGDSVVTDSRGRYSLEVPYGWSGDIVLSKEGYLFNPPSKSYSNVVTNLYNGVSTPPLVRGQNILSYNSRRSSAGTRSVIQQTNDQRVLIVPVDDIDSAVLAQTSEDLLVMSEILDGRFEEPRLIEGVFRDFGDFFGRDNRLTEAVYMQDYGVVFMMEVGYAFNIASDEQEQADGQDSNGSDSTWQRTRERILNPQASGQADRAERETGEMMVEELKVELIKTLKYAANIRNIQPEEWVILSVRGTGASSSMREIRYGPGYGSTGGYGGGGGGYGASGYGVAGSYGVTGGGYRTGGYGGGYNVFDEIGVSVPAAVMTIRAKKSDIDLYAQDELDYEQFRQKVQILMH